MGGAKTFFAIDDAGNQTILGYYSLSPASIAYARTPELVRRGLAVDLKLQGQGLGGQLLLAAGKRCLLASAEVGGRGDTHRCQKREGSGMVCELRRCAAAGCSAVPAVPQTTVEAALKAARK